MKINQRSREELAQALQKVQHALGLRPTKAAIVSALADMHWCSVNSSGIERTFLAAVKAAGLAVDGPFAKVMGVAPSGPTAVKLMAEPPGVKPSETATTTVSTGKPPKVSEDTNEDAIELPPKKDDGDFTVLNLKAISVIEASGASSQITFIGSKAKLAGSTDDSSLRSSCSLIEFAI